MRKSYHKEYLVVLVLVALAFMFTRCTSEEDLYNERGHLEHQIRELKVEKNDLQHRIEISKETMVELQEKFQEMSAKVEGRPVHYVVMLRLKQSHFTLDLTKHLKDAMNAIEFPIEVSESFYKSVNVGDKILDEFRAGSLLMRGSIGSWDITVADKKVTT